MMFYVTEREAVLKFLLRLTKVLGELGQLRAAEQHQHDDEDETNLGWAEACSEHEPMLTLSLYGLPSAPTIRRALVVSCAGQPVRRTPCER